MITIEIIESKDTLAIGVYPFLFDQIYIGRSKRADIQFTDKELPLKFLTIRCIRDQLVIQNEPETPFFYVNAKKMSGTRRLYPGDIIAFGTHKIKIIEFKRTDKDEDLSPYFEKLDKENPNLRDLLEILESKIIEIEEQKDHVQK